MHPAGRSAGCRHPCTCASGSANLGARYLQHLRRCQRARLASSISACSSRRLCVPLTSPAPALGAKGILPHTLLEMTVRANRKRPIDDECPQQLSLLLQGPRPKPKPRRAVNGKSDRPRILALDQRMSTAEVLRVVGVNRSTLFRWIRKSRFPRKHASGGWLRSEIELWLAEKTLPDAIADHQAVPPARKPFAEHT